MVPIRTDSTSTIYESMEGFEASTNPKTGSKEDGVVSLITDMVFLHIVKQN